MKYLVISYRNDEQMAMWDHVEAGSPEEAQDIVEQVRDYAIVSDTLTADQLREAAEALEADADVPSTPLDLARVLGEVEEGDTGICGECGEIGTLTDYRNGEGVCSGCAAENDQAAA